MIKVNKNIVLFLGIILLVGLASIALLERLPRLISHAVYYCQSSILSWMTPIPPQVLLLPFVLIGIFIAFALIKLAIMLIKAQMMKNQMMRNIHKDNTIASILTKLAITDKTYVIKSEKPFAFCLGIINARIYISTKLLQITNLKEVEVILRHELYHLNNRDTLTMIIASFCATMLPFFPILSDLIKNYRIDREIKADREAIVEKENKSLLISILKKILTNANPSVMFASAIVEHDTLEPRIAAITNQKVVSYKKYDTVNVIISTAFVLAISFALIGPVHAMHVHSANSHIIMLHSNGDACLDWSKNINNHS